MGNIRHGVEVQQKLLSGASQFFFSFQHHIFPSQAQFLSPRAAVPSPFTWVYYIARAVYRSKGGNLEPAQEVEEKKKKYFQLLKKLILIKERKEQEHTADDKMEDLRRDIRNDLLDWTKTNDSLRRTKSLKI